MAEKMSSWPRNARLARSLVLNVDEGTEGSVLAGDKYPEAVEEMHVALSAPIRNTSDYQYGITATAPRHFCCP